MTAATSLAIPPSVTPPATIAPSPVSAPLEHLSPHDLVTYFRCPHEMELHRAQHLSWRTGKLIQPLTPLDATPQSHSPLGLPPFGHLVATEGRLDVFSGDQLIYEDPDESGLPMIFPPDANHSHLFLKDHGATLVDAAWGLSGRPDLVVRHKNGEVTPVEYKETHLFSNLYELHGRNFDFLQALAECRLVEATWGVRPKAGIVYYGDTAGGGRREGWVVVPYGDTERAWLERALTTIRADRVRAPVPNERNCPSCEPNRDGLCKFTRAGFDRMHPGERVNPPSPHRFY